MAFSNGRYGTALSIDDYDDHCWADLWNVDQKELERRKREFHAPENIMAFELKPGAVAALDRLADHYDLAIVTARPLEIVETTRRYVGRHFPERFVDMRFVPIWEPDNKITKGDICRDMGASCLIDDMSRHCSAAAEKGIPAVLFGDYGWNRKVQVPTGVQRCQTWDEVTGLLLRDELAERFFCL